MHSYKQALLCVHAECIVHMDIKPNNILYNENTKKITLIDFGLSCFEKECQPGGTTRYMAREVLQERRDEISYPADIWSVGVTFAEWVPLMMQYLYKFDASYSQNVH